MRMRAAVPSRPKSCAALLVLTSAWCAEPEEVVRHPLVVAGFDHAGHPGNRGEGLLEVTAGDTGSPLLPLGIGGMSRSMPTSITPAIRSVVLGALPRLGNVCQLQVHVHRFFHKLALNVADGRWPAGAASGVEVEPSVLRACASTSPMV
jgi:hypothetical protein